MDLPSPARVRVLTAEQKETNRLRALQRRSQMTEEQKQAERGRARQRRAAMTAEQKEAERVRARERRALMTEEEKQTERQRAYDRQHASDRQPRRSHRYQCALSNPDGSHNHVEPHYIGTLSEKCPYEGCGALKFPGEKRLSLCCHGGKAVLPPFTPMPAFLYGLYLGRDALSAEQLASLSPAQSHLLDDPSIRSHFREHIRSYNSAMGLASLTFSQEEVRGRGPPIIRVHGQMHRRLPGCPVPDVQLCPVGTEEHKNNEEEERVMEDEEGGEK
jgi:hypothetical protein